MREITDQMIKTFKIDLLKFDFMGYTYTNLEELSFHHLIVPRRDWEKIGLEEKGYTFWNGAILVRRTSHDYLHIIEHYDPEVFFALTSEMIDENLNINLSIESLKRIRDLLLYFEHEHSHIYKKGEPIIKPEYIEKRISLNTLHKKTIKF